MWSFLAETLLHKQCTRVVSYASLKQMQWGVRACKPAERRTGRHVSWTPHQKGMTDCRILHWELSSARLSYTWTLLGAAEASEESKAVCTSKHCLVKTSQLPEEPPLIMCSHNLNPSYQQLCSSYWDFTCNLNGTRKQSNTSYISLRLNSYIQVIKII